MKQPAPSSSEARHGMSVDAALARARATPSGLSNEEAALRLVEYGRNELQTTQGTSPWMLLLEQFKNVLIIILLVATVISAFLGHGVEAIAIVVIVLFAVLLGFLQEFRAERAIEALRRMAAPTATTLRDGAEVELPSRDLVPGDIILLRAGNRVPADVRLTESVNLQVEEAALTGESVPVEKNTQSLPHDTVLADRRNMAYSSTLVTYGTGVGMVVETGDRTEIGRIN
jgi:P-type Ca2+ transporter type 2C